MRNLTEVRFSRRRWLQLGGAGLMLLHAHPAPARTADADSTGLIIGQPQAAEAGMRVLAAGEVVKGSEQFTAHVVNRSDPFSVSTPFKSVEIITNTPESESLFENMLREIGLSGTVRLEP
jgi:hypothetical protein